MNKLTILIVVLIITFFGFVAWAITDINKVVNSCKEKDGVAVKAANGSFVCFDRLMILK